VDIRELTDLLVLNYLLNYIWKAIK